jgi:hypothetical protein
MESMQEQYLINYRDQFCMTANTLGEMQFGFAGLNLGEKLHAKQAGRGYASDPRRRALVGLREQRARVAPKHELGAGSFLSA